MKHQPRDDGRGLEDRKLGNLARTDCKCDLLIMRLLMHKNTINEIVKQAVIVGGVKPKSSTAQSSRRASRAVELKNDK